MTTHTFLGQTIRTTGTLAVLFAIMLTSALAIGPRATARFMPQAVTTQIVRADGTATVTPAQWSSASGEADIYENGMTSDRMTLYFANLIPGGYYSVFNKQTGASDETLAPLDGSGEHVSFTAKASGTGYLEVVSNHKLTNQDAIVLVYHSDDKDHGMSAGSLGVTAFAQLVALAR